MQLLKEFWKRYQAEAVALMIIASAVPLALDWIAPNDWYGFRTPHTISAPEIWYRANSLMGYHMIGGQIVALLTHRRVGLALAARYGKLPAMWGMYWVCALSLLSIGTCALHFYSA